MILLDKIQNIIYKKPYVCVNDLKVAHLKNTIQSVHSYCELLDYNGKPVKTNFNEFLRKYTFKAFYNNFGYLLQKIQYTGFQPNEYFVELFSYSDSKLLATRQLYEPTGILNSVYKYKYLYKRNKLVRMSFCNDEKFDIVQYEYDHKTGSLISIEKTTLYGNINKKSMNVKFDDFGNVEKYIDYSRIKFTINYIYCNGLISRTEAFLDGRIPNSNVDFFYDNNNITHKKWTNSNGIITGLEEFVYDTKNNWIVRSLKMDSHEFVIKREIKYYE